MLKTAAVVAVLIMAVIVLAYMFGPHKCFLDLLNAQIARSTEFRPFYAGVPGLPETRELIPELGALEDAFPAVRAEALAVFEDHLRARAGAGGAEVPRMDETYNNIFFRGSGGSGGGLGARARAAAVRLVYGADADIFDRIGSADWRTFNLVVYGRDVPGNADRCPELVRHLRNVPGMQSALISIIAPGAYIPPHRDPAKGVIRYHLAFKVPRDRERCFIELIDGDRRHRYHWAEGRGVVFDDVFDHWVLNDTDEYRVILFVDILRPLRGAPRALQSLANLANRYHPGVRRLVRASRLSAPGI